MCGLCGIFPGSEHWTDAAVGVPKEAQRTRRHTRLHRVAVANRILKLYSLKVSDWGGNAYVISNATGQSQLVENIAALWPAAEALRKGPLDPLDERVIQSLENLT